MLKIRQPHHQPRRLRGSSEWAIEAAKLVIEPVPVDQTGQPEQLVLLIEDLIEPAAIEIVGARHRRLGPHGKIPVLSGSVPGMSIVDQIVRGSHMPTAAHLLKVASVLREAAPHIREDERRRNPR